MNDSDKDTLVSARDVTKTYQVGKVEAPALRGITLDVRSRDFLAVVGPSGSGKTTLLNLIGALDSATDGKLTVLGNDLSTMSKRHRADMRLHSLGFVFQAYNLVPVLTARENVEFVLELQGVGSERSRRAMEILEQLDLGEFADRKPSELSGGVASRPKLVLADEPTANLDGENAEILLKMMQGLNEQQNITFIFSTHDPRVVAYARRVVRLVDGRVSSDEMKKSASLPGTEQKEAED